MLKKTLALGALVASFAVQADNIAFFVGCTEASLQKAAINTPIDLGNGAHITISNVSEQDGEYKILPVIEVNGVEHKALELITIKAGETRHLVCAREGANEQVIIAAVAEAEKTAEETLAQD